MHNVLFYLIYVSRNLINKMNLITTTFVTLTLYLIVLAFNRIFTAADETTESGEPTKCGKNEEYTTCNLCLKNCENPFREICSPEPCIKTCKCKSGYYKDSGGVCVSIIACIVDNIRNRSNRAKRFFFDKYVIAKVLKLNRCLSIFGRRKFREYK